MRHGVGTGVVMTHILLNLADILDEACAILEERGQSLSTDIEETIAQRITHCAKSGERDHDRLLAAALEGLVAEEYSLDRLLLN
jgi:hypothetical protein